MPLTPEQSRINGRKGGRPKTVKTIAVEKMREYMVKRIAENMGPLMDAQLDLALGHKVVDAEGVVYIKGPDREAAKYLMDQGAGRPKESVEVTGEGGGPLNLGVTVTDATNRVYKEE